MKRIRIVQIGDSHSSEINNTIISLSELQNQYYIEIDPVRLNIPKRIDPKNPDGLLSRALRTHIIKYDYPEYPIGIVNIPLENNNICVSNESAALISVYKWKSFCQYSVETGLKYLIATLLLDIKQVIGAYHEDTRGCPNDLCNDLRDINKGIRKADYCSECKAAFNVALETGRITWPELASVYRILDSVAKRKIAFVIMPFHKKFNGVYAAIKQILGKFNYHSIRADEIFQTRSIMHIVNETISRSSIVIADLTDRNPNVFYELGLAHAQGKSTVILAQNEEDIPFDLRDRQYVVYKPGRKLRTNLSRKLQVYIR